MAVCIQTLAYRWIAIEHLLCCIDVQVLTVIVLHRVLQCKRRGKVLGDGGLRGIIEVRCPVVHRWLHSGEADRVGEERGVELAVELADGGLL